MTFQRELHLMVQNAEFSRVEADQVGAQFTQASPHAICISGQIEGPEWTHLTVADDARISFNPNNGRIENGHRLAPGPAVTSLAEREFDSIGENASDFHRPYMIGLGYARPYLNPLRS